MNLHGLIAKILDCSLKVSEFHFQSCHYVYFRTTNTFEKGMNSLSPSYVLNSLSPSYVLNFLSLSYELNFLSLSYELNFLSLSYELNSLFPQLWVEFLVPQLWVEFLIPQLCVEFLVPPAMCWIISLLFFWCKLVVLNRIT